MEVNGIGMEKEGHDDMTTHNEHEEVSSLERMLTGASLPQVEETIEGMIGEAIRCGVAWGAEHGNLPDGSGDSLPRDLAILAESLEGRWKAYEENAMANSKPNLSGYWDYVDEDEEDDDSDDWDDQPEEYAPKEKGLHIDGREDARSRLGFVVAWERGVDCLTVRVPRDVSESRFETVAAFPTYDTAMAFIRLIETELGGYDGWIRRCSIRGD